MLPAPTRPDQGPVEGQAELGYRLARRWWRQGLAGEGARELLRHAFEDLGLQRVLAETMAVNTASRATMASVGLRTSARSTCPSRTRCRAASRARSSTPSRARSGEATRTNPGDTSRRAT